MEAGQEDKHAGTQHGANELSIRAHAEQAERRGGALPHGPGGEHSSHHQDLSAGSVGSFLPASVDASRRLSRFGVGAREQNGELLSEEKSKPAPQPNQRKGPEEVSSLSILPISSRARLPSLCSTCLFLGLKCYLERSLLLGPGLIVALSISHLRQCLEQTKRGVSGHQSDSGFTLACNKILC